MAFPGFPLSGTLVIEGSVSFLACDDAGGGPPTLYKLWRSDPPDGAPDHDAAQRATVYLEDQLGKDTNDLLTVQDGLWPFPFPSNVLCIIDAS
jgi:hypothetical protein